LFVALRSAPHPPRDDLHGQIARARELLDQGDLRGSLELLERARNGAHGPTVAASTATAALWQILSLAHQTRDLASDERTLIQAYGLATEARADLNDSHRRQVADARHLEQIERFRERAERPPKRPLLLAGVVWAVLLPVWIAALFVAAAVGGSYGESIHWPELAISVLLFAAPWLVLGRLTIGWWREGRNNLWRPPLMWLLLLIPYLWPALLSRRARSLLSASRPE
jgi:hypothetical protein